MVSAPPGLTFVVVSGDAKKAMAERKTPIASFYANLTTFAHYYEEKWFPYTMPISDIYGLRAAIDNIADDPAILSTPRQNRHSLQKGHYRRRPEPLSAQRIFQYSYCF